MERHLAEDYDIYVGRDRLTAEYVAIVREFPSLSWVSVDRKLAAVGMRDLLAEVLADMYEDGDPVPAPLQGRVELQDLELAGANG
jgi:predicted RNase H-like HicB family nuclease